MTDKDKYVIFKMFMFVMRALILILTDGGEQDLCDRYQDFCELLNKKYWLDKDAPS